MLKLVRKYLFVLLAIMCVLGAWLVNSYFKGADFHQRYIEQVTRSLQTQAGNINKTLDLLEQKLSKDVKLSFDNFEFESEYPLFIFADNNFESKAIYWSDHQYEIDYEDINSYFVDKCIERINDRI